MKYAVFTLVLLLAAITPAFGQASPGGEQLEFEEPTPDPAHGGAVINDPFVAGVYLLVPAHQQYAKSELFNTMLTLNADGCADSSSLWDGDLSVGSGGNTGAHGTWQLTPRTRDVQARLYYFSNTAAGLTDRVGRATLIANLNRDFSGGSGQIVFDSFLPGQLPEAFEAGSREQPLGGRLTIDVRLVQLR